MRFWRLHRSAVLGCVSLALIWPNTLLQDAWAQPPHFRVTAEGTCLGNDLIDKSVRENIDSAALQFVDTVRGITPKSAETMVAEAARASLTPDALAGLGPRVSAMLKGTPTISLTYLVKVAVQTKSIDTAGCPVPGAPDKTWDHVATVNVPEQAHVLLISASGEPPTAVELWLVPEGGSWKVNGFWANYTTLDGVSGAEAWANARRERAAGHTDEAAHWYHVAAQLLYLGPYFYSGTFSEFEADARAFIASQNGQARATPPT